MTDIRDMMDDIEMELGYTARLIGKETFDPKVMQALREVPRDHFVPREMRRFAFANGPLPIGYGQTISQPYIVALMTDLLEPGPHHRILEVGTGSGYQAAVLSRVVREVYTMEIVEPLASAAEERLRILGYENVHVRSGDAYDGWEEASPFDGIIVTAAAPSIPAPLVRQLRPGGRMVLPVGPPYGHQELELLIKGDKGENRVRSVLGVAFVPLTRSPDAVSPI